MSESENVAGRQAQRCKAVFPGREQHQEKLHRQGHLRTVRAAPSSATNADNIQSSMLCVFSDLLAIIVLS